MTKSKLYRQPSNRKPAGGRLCTQLVISSLPDLLKSVVKTYNRKLIPFAQQMRREMTKAEARLWFGLLRDFTPRVRRQRPFGRFIADFYCAACKVVIEVDGAQHFTPEGLVADVERSAFLEGLGLRVVRFSNADVLENLTGVSLRVLEVLKVVESDKIRIQS